MDTTNNGMNQGGPSSASPLMSGNNSKRSLAYLLGVVVLALVVYYSGVWGWLEGQFAVTTKGEEVAENVKNEDVAVTAGQATINGDEVEVKVVNENNTQSETASVAAYPKGKLAIMVNLGAGLEKLVVRQFEIYNQAKDSWIVLYDGYKEFMAKDALPGGKMLTEVSLAALNYSKARAKVLDGATPKEVALGGVTVTANPVSATVTFTADGKGELKTN